MFSFSHVGRKSLLSSLRFLSPELLCTPPLTAPLGTMGALTNHVVAARIFLERAFCFRSLRQLDSSLLVVLVVLL